MVVLFLQAELRSTTWVPFTGTSYIYKIFAHSLQLDCMIFFFKSIFFSNCPDLLRMIVLEPQQVHNHLCVSRDLLQLGWQSSVFQCDYQKHPECNLIFNLMLIQGGTVWFKWLNPTLPPTTTYLILALLVFILFLNLFKLSKCCMIIRN